MRKRILDFTFFKKTEFWVTTIIAILLTFLGGFFAGKTYVYYYGDSTDIKNNQNCIIDSPNSVQSINQQGGITTGNITIETPKREITKDFISELNRYLPKSKENTIKITSIIGDTEAYQFAEKIEQYLELNSWKVEGIDQAIYNKPVIGVVVKSNEQGNIELVVGSKP